jgi:hypothetical protein
MKTKLLVLLLLYLIVSFLFVKFAMVIAYVIGVILICLGFKRGL